MRDRRLWPVMLSVAECASAIGAERRVIYQMIKNGMPVYRIGVKRRILTADFVEAIRLTFKREES